MPWPFYATDRFVNDDHRHEGALRGREETIAEVDDSSCDVELMDAADTWVWSVPANDLELRKGVIVMRAEVGADHPLWDSKGALSISNVSQ